MLAIASKNEESIALEAIAKHPEMVLRIDDFAGWRINWEDKAINIVGLVSELNLGLQSAVFLDDSTVERARVNQALPEVLVPDWPEDPVFFPSALLELDCFDTSSITQQDLDRTRQYASQRQREDSRRLLSSPQEWPQKLGTTVNVEEPNEGNLKRIVQLLAKTSQMNPSTTAIRAGAQRLDGEGQSQAVGFSSPGQVWRLGIDWPSEPRTLGSWSVNR